MMIYNDYIYYSDKSTHNNFINIDSKNWNHNTILI